jgi:hypothetical protein
VAKLGIDIRDVPESKVIRHYLSLHTPVDTPLTFTSSSVTPNIYLY